MWTLWSNSWRKFLGLAALAALPAGLSATPVDTIIVSVDTGTYTAGVSTNTSGQQLLVICFRNGSSAPDEVETVNLFLVKNGTAPITGGMSSLSFNTVPGTIVYGITPPIPSFTFFKADNGYNLMAVASSTQSVSANAFNVARSTATRLLVRAPGQVYDPGKDPSAGNTGLTGTPTVQEPNQAFALEVILTDTWFNRVDAAHAVSFASAGDLIQLPAPGSLSSSGSASFNVNISAPRTSRTITVSDDTDAAVQSGAVTIITTGPPPQEVFAFPSPFNPNAGGMTFRFQVENADNVALLVKDAFGQDVWKRDVTAAKGFNNVSWDGRNENGNVVAAGVYYVLLEVGGSVKSKKRFGVVK